MNLEIPKIETDQENVHSKIYERAVKILEANPERDWKDNPDLVYIDLQDNGEDYMVRKIDIEDNGDQGGLSITLFYLPSEVPFNKFKRIQLADCGLYSFRLSDEEKEKKIRDLTDPTIGIQKDDYRAPDPEEVRKLLRHFEEVKKKKRMEEKERSFVKRFLNKR